MYLSLKVKAAIFVFALAAPFSAANAALPAGNFCAAIAMPPAHS